MVPVSTRMRICRFLGAHGPSETAAILAHMAPLHERAIRTAVQVLLEAKLIAFDGFGVAPAHGGTRPKRWRVTPAGRRMVSSTAAPALTPIRDRRRFPRGEAPIADAPVEGFGHGIGRMNSPFDTGHLVDLGDES